MALEIKLYGRFISTYLYALWILHLSHFGKNLISWSVIDVFRFQFNSSYKCGPLGPSSQSSTDWRQTNMWDFLFSLRFTKHSPSSSFSNVSSTRRESLPVHSNIIRRNIVTDFLEATSIPVNVPIQRSKHADGHTQSVREEHDHEEHDQHTHHHPEYSDTKLFNSPPKPCGLRQKLSSRGTDSDSDEEEEERRKRKSKRKKKRNVQKRPELIFFLEL